MKVFAIIYWFFNLITNALFAQELPKKPNEDDVRAYNQANLLKINIGDDKNTVISQMGGIQSIKVYLYDWYNPGFNKNKKVGIITNPYSRDMMIGKDSSTIEILWYYTDMKKNDGAISKDELTPIILEKNSVVGLGWGYYQDYAKRKEITIDVR